MILYMSLGTIEEMLVQVVGRGCFPREYDFLFSFQFFQNIRWISVKMKENRPISEFRPFRIPPPIRESEEQQLIFPQISNRVHSLGLEFSFKSLKCSKSTICIRLDHKISGSTVESL